MSALFEEMIAALRTFDDIVDEETNSSRRLFYVTLIAEGLELSNIVSKEIFNRMSSEDYSLTDIWEVAHIHKYVILNDGRWPEELDPDQYWKRLRPRVRAGGCDTWCAVLDIDRKNLFIGPMKFRGRCYYLPCQDA